MFMLKPSTIHGVGVFTDIPIKKGKKIDFECDDWRFVPDTEVPKHQRRFFRLYASETVIDGVYGWIAPLDFHRMSVSWHLNHADSANLITHDKGDTFYAVRDIAIDEELTINYQQLDQNIDNTANVRRIRAGLPPLL